MDNGTKAYIKTSVNRSKKKAQSRFPSKCGGWSYSTELCVPPRGYSWCVWEPVLPDWAQSPGWAAGSRQTPAPSSQLPPPLSASKTDRHPCQLSPTNQSSQQPVRSFWVCVRNPRELTDPTDGVLSNSGVKQSRGSYFPSGCVPFSLFTDVFLSKPGRVEQQLRLRWLFVIHSFLPLLLVTRCSVSLLTACHTYDKGW